MRGIAQPGAILRNAWKQCSNSKYGVGVKIGEVWELGVIVLHHFDMMEGGKAGENAKHEEISQKIMILIYQRQIQCWWLF